MEKIFYPQSIVVIGVSERPTNMARFIVGNLINFGYGGELYAVGPRGGEVCGIPIRSSVEELPEGIDLAVLLTPARAVPDLLDACGCRGIRWAVVESAGFGEFSPEGRRLEERLCAVARRWGIRFVGPNCISVINMENGVCLPFAPLSREAVLPGRVSVLAQSGAVTMTSMELLSTAGLGVNKAVSMGNKLDLNEADYLAYLLEDEGTDIVCIHLEGIADGRRLMELARSSDKPIVLLKANTGRASAEIAHSHTAALADDDRIVSAAARQAGMVRVGNFRDLLVTVKGLSLPRVRGDDLVVISRSGGHAVLAADAAQAYGFRLPPFPREVLEQVRESARADVIRFTNPLDLGDVFDLEAYVRTVEESLRRLEPDGVVFVHTYRRTIQGEESRRMLRAIQQVGRNRDTPIVIYPVTESEEMAALPRMLRDPIFTEVDEAMKALAASRERYRWEERRTKPRSSESCDVSADKQAAVRKFLDLQDRRVLMVHQSLALCRACGIPVAEGAVARNVEEALRAAERLGWPLALKVLSPDISHKSDVGGVVLGVADEVALVREFEGMLGRVRERAPTARVEGVLLQRELRGGREVIVGGKQDRSFGPVVMFGLGGVYVEVFDDAAFRVAPLTRADAAEMIEEVRGSRLLRGVRGESAADVEAVVEALLALSRLLVECPEVVEVDINPLLVFERSVAAVDARVVVKRQKT